MEKGGKLEENKEVKFKEVMRFTLWGIPRTKKTSQRIVMRGKYPIIIPSEKYLQYEKDCGRQITGKYKNNLKGLYNLKVLYYRKDRRAVDLSNLLQATCDILQKFEVLEGDDYKTIYGFDGSRVLFDKKYPRAEIIIEEVEL